MELNHIFARCKLVQTVIAASLLATVSAHAQTFMGQPKLDYVPAGLEAVIFPVTTIPGRINVIFNNPTHGPVQVVIRNEAGEKVYNQYEYVARYRRYFNLLDMPPGKYTVELSKNDVRLVQSFSIEPPTQGQITMGNLPEQKTREKPAEKKLIVSY
ncbi:hypothetical protein [Spirosoma sp. KNUC1025]|uniref:hypothetical protein n=1 Tax=Spirosoma sp. KNUC1025 TaxID=2894082 RepID=UPI00386B0510|nr:hypothetical protein LN737_25140 [Spirosoma sp. KNUC1025]